jgi:hypothetical protein
MTATAQEPPETTAPLLAAGAGDGDGAAAAGACDCGDGELDCDWLGAEEPDPEPLEPVEPLEEDCGSCTGPWRPSELGLASAGICRDGADERGAEDRVALVGVGTAAPLRSVCPWAVAETNAASPPVRPAAPAISHRRARPIRVSAASR